MPEYRILTHDTTSKSYEKLLAALPGRGIRPSGSTYHYQQGDIIINWGVYGQRGYPIAVNQHDAVKACCSKQRSYQAFNNNGVRTVFSTKTRDLAQQWLLQGYNVYSRASDYGCQGSGIMVNKAYSQELRMGEFYTRGFSIHREFRIYVWRDQVLGTYEKKDGTGGTLDHDIRASDDWLYCRDHLADYPNELLLQAIGAVQAIGLDFAGVDIALDSMDNVCVFECNSAPWLSPSITTKLAQKIRETFPLS